MRTTLIATLVLTLLGQAGAHAADDQFTTNQPSLQDTDREAVSADDRLMIVNGNTGHVIYDDGHDDLFCVTRRHVVGYDLDGNPVRRRSMHCR